MNNEVKLYSYSRLNLYETCQRKYYFNYERHWQSSRTAAALAFGAAWGTALDEVWKSLASNGSQLGTADTVNEAMMAFIETYTKAGMPHPDEMDVDMLNDISPRTPQVAEAMLWEYIDARRAFLANIELLGVEEPFVLPVYPNDPTRFYVGKMDKVYRDLSDNRVYCLDHKTTTQYAKNGFFRSTFTNSFSPNSQMDGYLYALLYKYAEEAQHVVIDACLVHKSVHDGYAFLPVYHSIDALNAWLWDMRRKVGDIEREAQLFANFKMAVDSQQEDTLRGAYPRATHSCHTFSPCAFVDICSTISNPEQIIEPPEGFQFSEESTAERLGLSDELIQKVVNLVKEQSKNE